MSGLSDVARIGTDQDAFEAFYRTHVDAVQRFVVRRVDDRDRAADLTTEVFLAAIDSAHRYQSARGTPGAWLYGVARNVMANDRRQRGRELDAQRRIGGRRPLDGDDIARWDERIDASARSRELYAALAGLTERERAVVELVWLDGLPVVEAAQSIGIAAVTARMRLSRARRRLRDSLADESPLLPATEPAVRGLNPTEAS